MAQRIDDEIVLYESKKGEYFGLDAIGGVMWDAIVTYRTYEDALAFLQKYFDADKERIAEDFERIVEALRQNGLLECSE